jgi:B-cell receptor-associated protein 31
MSLQWGLVAGFLYVEIAVLIILLLPGISPQRWLKIFRSRILHSLGVQTQLYFYGLFGLLCLLFLDAIREMRKYSNEEFDLNINPKAEMQAHMKLFRAQRNFYISGFALLLSLIIRRIATLLSNQGSLLAQNEAVMRQATSATDAAQKLLNEKSKGGSGDSKKVQNSKDDVEALQTQINTLKDELKAVKTDRDAVKSQAESVSKEYDRLMKEHEKLQKKVAIQGEKKSD